MRDGTIWNNERDGITWNEMGRNGTARIGTGGGEWEGNAEWSQEIFTSAKIALRSLFKILTNQNAFSVGN